FIGPCIAKKAEAADPDLPREVDAVLTFAELQQMLLVGGIKPESVAPVDFDPPIGGLGGLFPLNRGMLQAASIHEDLITGDVISAEGRAHFVEAIKDFEDENLDVSLLEVLCCNGCIMGAGMTTHASLFNRRARVSQSVRRRMTSFDKAQWWGHMERFAGLDLSRTYSAFDQRIAPPSFAKLSEIMARMGKHGPEDELNCGACGYDTCREHAIAIFKGLAEIEMCLPFAIEKLRSTVKDLAVSNQQLAETQEALMQSEKLASMGQLAAGIAHELNNPLGVVLMYAHLMLDEHERDPKVREDLQMISDQADRCKKIVAGLLHFARQNKVDLEPADLREWVAGALRLNPAPENVSVRVEHCEADSTVEADASQMLQVLANLIWNAYAAMPDGGELSIQTNGDAEWVRIAIADTGVGIPKENMAKVFEPFFTTKENGKGTGLGLAVSYGIVKMHRGSIDVISNSDPQIGPTGSTFVVKLPRHVVSEPPSEKAESLLET
ncbi:MAG TPA: ATP-binding protein, partial [Candidatus Hydrogenedentes bacterium]|nr:ATP-binding protein [Candidatus Hydrogenedentota bacterium]